jgi:pilus assembly protein CpaF
LQAEGRILGDAGVLAVVDALRRESVGAGPLEPLLRSAGVTDVLVNGARAVYVDRGNGLEISKVTFPNEDAVRRLAQRLAGTGGRRLDDATPFVDVRLPDATRFHAVLAPVARPGTCLSLRVPARRAFTLAELVAAEALSADGAALLADIVAARLAFLVSGGTGSGKTTLLAALLSLVPPAERIVLVEDSNELAPEHVHVVGLEARPPNVEGAGEIVLRDLVRQALRMRPDRLVVGEVRGAEDPRSSVTHADGRLTAAVRGSGQHGSVPSKYRPSSWPSCCSGADRGRGVISCERVAVGDSFPAVLRHRGLHGVAVAAGSGLCTGAGWSAAGAAQGVG